MDIKEIQLSITVPSLPADAPAVAEFARDIQEFLETLRYDVAVTRDANGKIYVSVRNLQANTIEETENSLLTYVLRCARSIGIDPYERMPLHHRSTPVNIAIESTAPATAAPSDSSAEA